MGMMDLSRVIKNAQYLDMHLDDITINICQN